MKSWSYRSFSPDRSGIDHDGSGFGGETRDLQWLRKDQLSADLEKFGEVTNPA